MMGGRVSIFQALKNPRFVGFKWLSLRSGWTSKSWWFPSSEKSPFKMGFSAEPAVKLQGVFPSPQDFYSQSICLVGWINPSEKHIHQIGSFPPSRGEHKRYLKPPPRFAIQRTHIGQLLLQSSFLLRENKFVIQKVRVERVRWCQIESISLGSVQLDFDREKRSTLRMIV